MCGYLNNYCTMQIRLIGNKCDWEARRVVPRDRGEELARSQGIPFLETSAKTNHNIDEVRDPYNL